MKARYANLAGVVENVVQTSKLAWDTELLFGWYWERNAAYTLARARIAARRAVVRGV